VIFLDCDNGVVSLGYRYTENKIADYSLVYLVLNLFIIALCRFVYLYNGCGCVCVCFVLYGCVILQRGDKVGILMVW
jgi:hypothetical protein